jgi:di/tricarboxylate transporter
MYEALKTGGRKSNATLLIMIFITITYSMQYIQITAFMILEMNDVCLPVEWTSQYPTMSPEWYAGTMVALLGMFGVSNAAATYGENQNT